MVGGYEHTHSAAGPLNLSANLVTHVVPPHELHNNVVIAVQTCVCSDHHFYFRKCVQVANTVRLEAIKMLSEVRSRADGRAKRGTVQLDAQLVRQVVFAKV